MVNYLAIYICLMSFMLIFILGLVYFDYQKKRVLRKRPSVSFILPCYNDGATVEKTIKSIYDSYDRKKIELIVANDKSTDNSLEILKNLKKKYGFVLLNNKENMGKSKTLNGISKLAKNEILWVIDADIILTKEAVEDVLARFEYNPKVAAVSCPYIYENKTFFERMQSMECNLMSLLQVSENLHTCLSLWGGCLAVRKSAFEKVGRFSENMLTEDIELSFKLAECRYKVEQSMCHVTTFSTDNLSSWFKQKKRWSAGAIQCYLRHWKVWLRHPMQIFFLIVFTTINLFLAFSLIKEVIFLNIVWDNWELMRSTSSFLFSFKIIGLFYGLQIIKGLLLRVSFSGFSIPYTYSFLKSPKQLLNVFYAIPFSLLYLPAFTVVFIYSLPQGIKSYLTMKKGQRSW